MESSLQTTTFKTTQNSLRHSMISLPPPPNSTVSMLNSPAQCLGVAKHSPGNTNSSQSFLLFPAITRLIKRSHHMRYHQKPKTCERCGKSFGTITHLEGHINSFHERTKRFYCTVAGCKYSKTGLNSAFFSRKDNWRRHMSDKHRLS